MSTSADNVGDNTVVFVPTFTTFYQFHVFHFDASSVHCSGMGYLDGEAQLGKMSVPDLLNPNHDEYVTPFDFKKSIPQQYRGNKSGSMPQCPNPASEQVINEYVKNITGKFPSGALIHLQVTNRSDTYMGGPAYLGNWDLKMPTQASGLVERKNSGQWYVRLTDATTSPQKSGWRNRGGK